MSEFKVVITDREYADIDNELRILKQIDADVYDYQYKDMESILRVAKDCDALIVQYAKIPRELIEQMDCCKIIARYATGVDGIDLQAATDHGIFVTNVNDYCKDEVSSHALALLLESSRRTSVYNEWTHKGQWFDAGIKLHSLKESVIGVIGFGKIARLFIEKVKPLCNNIWVYDAFVDPAEMELFGVKSKGLEEIFVNSDYISIHCPLNEETHHMFNRDVFQRMKNTAALINVARGGVICEEDLIQALQAGEIGGAALDVMEAEPPMVDNPLFQMENVIITPHTAWYSEESQVRLQSTVAEDVVRVLSGEKPENLVNRDILHNKK